MKKQRKIRYFNQFCNQAELFSTPLPEEFFNKQPEELDWYSAKLLLKHKSCSHEFRMRYINSTYWYERLTASLAKPARGQYSFHAMKDKDIRVRRAAFYGSFPEEVIRTPEAASLVVKEYESVKNTINPNPANWAGLRVYRIIPMYNAALQFLTEYEQSLKSPSLGLLSPNEDIRKITKERLDVLSKV